MAWKYLLFRLRMVRFALTVKPVWGGSADDPPKEDPPKEDPPKEDPPKEEDDEPVDKDDDWKAKARKHERDLKKERKQREETERKLKEREDADKSEQEKALDEARKEAREAAEKDADKGRRADRLEVAVTRLAAKGITVGEGDDKKVVRFADAEDALLNVERAVRAGDIDSDDIYDSEGKVKTESLTEALGDLLQRKPHLAAGEEKVPAGDADARKGEAASDDLEDKSVEDHIERKYPARK